MFGSAFTERLSFVLRPKRSRRLGYRINRLAYQRPQKLSKEQFYELTNFLGTKLSIFTVQHSSAQISLRSSNYSRHLCVMLANICIY